MRKQERFAVYGYVRDSFEDVERMTNQRMYITDFDSYPTDEELEGAWEKAKQDYSKVFYLNVEKQIRFM